MAEIKYGQFESVSELMTRITEANDTRITEAGDIRITNEALSNTVEGSLVADPTLIPGTKNSYININGTWTVFIPYVKNSGTWQEPNAIYKKISGNWKRVY
jgi:hypothetical protein